MKSGRQNVMFIHQPLPSSASTDNGGSTTSTKKRGRPKKMKLTEQPHQTVVTTPGASSVIKETASCANNSNGCMEEACTSPTPLQIDLSPSVINNDEQNNTEMVNNEPVAKDDTNKSVINPTILNNEQSVSSFLPATTKKQRIRRSSTIGRVSYGEQAKAVEAGKKLYAENITCISILVYLYVCINNCCVYVFL